MPRLLAVQEIKLEWGDIEGREDRPKPPQERSPGVHLMGVVRYMAVKSGILAVDSTGKWVGAEVDEEVFPLRMALGMAWEEWAAGMYPLVQWQPGEVRLEGVAGTPDGVHTDWSDEEGQWVVVVDEFKVTWKSEWNYGKDRFLRANWMWMSQGKGYCKLMDTRYVKYHVLWVNGDYRPPSPKYMTYMVRFDEQEIETFWGMVLRNRDKEGVVKE